MPRIRNLAVFAVLLGLTVYFGGMLSYKVLSESVLASYGHMSTARHGLGANTDSVNIEGRAEIRVLRPDGSLRSAWKGHNSLTSEGREAIAKCATYLVTPALGCYNWTSQIRALIYMSPLGSQSSVVDAANTLDYCPGPGGSTFACGWTAKSAEIAVLGDGKLGVVEAGKGAGTAFVAFDRITVIPSVSVNPGDRVVVTIAFTVPS